MKTKITCGLLALSVLCVLLVSFPVQANENALEWVKIDKPGLRGNIVVSPSEVSEIAVGRSDTIYAVDSSENATKSSKVYKSVDGGQTWEDITSPLSGAGAGLPAGKIAVAPDTSSIVAVVTDSGTDVYLSTDGGATWDGTGVPGSVTGTIQAIAISKQYTEEGESVREIAIGTAEWGNNTTTGGLWVFRVGISLPSWQNQSLTVDLSHTVGEVSAIAYSPNYQRDNTIIVVASTGNDVDTGYENKTWLCLGKRDTTAGTTSWDTFSGYPVEIATASSPSAGDATTVTWISSSLALPSNYSSSDEDLRQLFVSYDRYPEDASDDVYRFDDTNTYRLNAGGGTAIDISSIAYYGTITSGKLLAGDVSPITGSPTVRVRRTSNPFASSPTWQLSSTPPSGPGNAKVSWSSDGSSAYCGTSQSPGDALDESAFSMSSDDGDNWQQLSLMDTTIMLSDIAPTPESDTLFLTTYSQYGPEGIWRSARTQPGLGWYWSRQLTISTTSNRVILRLSPDYTSDYTIYAAEAGGNLMAVSHNRGNSWKERRALSGVVDIIVEDEDTLYAALPGGYIRKSTNSAWTWGEQVHTGLPSINMLAIAEKGTVLVGGRDGEVAYSTDGGASFTRIADDIGTGDVQVVADANYHENGIIYAATDASDSGIWRWTIGLSTIWEQIDESITTLNTGQCISGLAMGSGGTLYALRLEQCDDNSGGMTRSLNPAARYDSEIEFDFTNAALPEGTAFNPSTVFNHALPHLKLSGDTEQNELWALDTDNEVIYRFQDTLAIQAPTLISPSDGFQNEINQVTGRSADIAFNWNSPSKSVTDYELGIYIDAACTSCIQLCSVPSTGDMPVVAIGPYQPSAANQFVEYNAGATYYWRVRATGPIKSPWSETRDFSIADLPEAQPPVIEVTPAPAITIEPPEIVLSPQSEAPSDAAVPPSAPQPTLIAPTYVWTIIIIGTILVIVLIVLIVRTGRHV